MIKKKVFYITILILKLQKNKKNKFKNFFINLLDNLYEIFSEKTLITKKTCN